MTCSYESTDVIDLSEQNALAQTASGETSVVNETERQATPASPSMVRLNRGTDVLDPEVQSSPYQKIFLSIAIPSQRIHHNEDTPPKSIKSETLPGDTGSSETYSMPYAFSQQRQLSVVHL